MKQFIFLLLCLFTVNAFAHKEKIDPDCDKMATNAKGFAQLKLTGLATTPEQLGAFVVSPTVQSYPIKSIVNYVFSQEGKTPQQIYDSLYGRCVLMGYSELFQYFTDKEDFESTKTALLKANNEISKLKNENQSLLKENADMHLELLHYTHRR